MSSTLSKLSLTQSRQRSSLNLEADQTAFHADQIAFNADQIAFNAKQEAFYADSNTFAKDSLGSPVCIPCSALPAPSSPRKAMSPIGTPTPPRSPISLESRLVPPRTSIQSIAEELGFAELGQEDILYVGELAMELYKLLRVKTLLMRFKCLCLCCSIPACHESEREVLRRAVKEICAERKKFAA